MHERPYQAEEGSLDRHSPSTTTPSSPAPSEDSSSSKESASAHSTNHDEYADSCPYTVGFVATALGHEPPDPFDPEFTGETPVDSVVDDSHMLSATVQEQFVGFSYNGPNDMSQGGESLR